MALLNLNRDEASEYLREIGQSAPSVAQVKMQGDLQYTLKDGRKLVVRIGSNKSKLRYMLIG